MRLTKLFDRFRTGRVLPARRFAESRAAASAVVELVEPRILLANPDLVKDIHPGGGYSNPSAGVMLNGSLIFSAGDAAGYSLWRSDGTESGTVRLTDPGITGGSLTVAGDNLYFIAQGSNRLAVLPGGSGTPVDLQLGDVHSLLAIGDDLYVGSGDGLYKVSGSSAVLLDSFTGSGASWGLGGFANVGGTLHLQARQIFVGDGIWTTNGLPGAANLLVPGAGAPFEFNGRLHYLKGAGASSASQVFRLDAGNHETQITFENADHSQVADRPLVTNAGFFYSGYDDAHGIELWFSAGGPGSERLVRDIHPGPFPNNYDQGTGGLRPFGNGVIFFADDGTGGSSLWAANTSSATRLAAGFNGYAANLVAAGGKMFFAGAAGGGQFVWSTNGTPAGTVKVSDVSTQNLVGNLDGTLLFAGYGDARGVPAHELGVELWSLNTSLITRPPVIANKTFSVAENKPNGSLVGTVTASDPDGQPIVFSIVGGNTNDAFSIHPTTGQLTVANSAALDRETTPFFDLIVQATDDGSPPLSRTATVRVNLSNVNDPPAVLNFGPDVAYTENGAGILLDSDVAFGDPDATGFNGGNVAVKLTANAAATDRLTIRNQGTAANQVGVSGSDVTYGGTVIGSFTGGTGATPLVVTFNSVATSLAARAVLRNVLFSNVSDNPGGLPRTVQVTVKEGTSVVSSPVMKTINVAAVNDRPVLGVIPSPQGYVENAAAKQLAPNATVVDPDSPDFDGGKLTVKYTAGGLGSDRLTIRDQGTGAGQVGVSGSGVTFGGTPIGSFAGGTGLTALVVTFNAAATPAAAQAVLRNILYHNISDNPTNFGAAPSRTVSYLFIDGDGGTSVAVNQTLNITAVNDAPVVANFADAASYTAGAGPTILDPNATLVDADSADFAGGMLTLVATVGGAASNVFGVRHEGSAAGQIGVVGTDVQFGGVSIGAIDATAPAGSLRITWNTNATAAGVQALVRNLTFRSTAVNPTGPKTLSLIVTDGDGGSVTAFKQLAITSALAAPTSRGAFAAYADWEANLP